MSIKLSASLCALAIALAACSQGSEIASPGPSNPGTPPGGGSGGGGGGGGSVTCPTGFTEGTSVPGVPLTICNVTGRIATNVTIPQRTGVAYKINGRVEVGADMGADGTLAGGVAATLTVQPGVTLFGANEQDVMIVNRGSRLVADGFSTSPIVFTSAADLQRQYDADPANDDGDDFIGEWAGLILLGQAPISRCAGSGAPGTAACSNIIEGVTNPAASYGGADPNDDSGVLRYVQVRFPGDPLDAVGNDLNGITFGGIGRNTVVDFVHVHNSHDDGVEFFGGTVNVKHLVITGADDDSVDTDNGYQGNIQYLVVEQRASFADNVFEASNVAAGSLPASNHRVSNFTVVGGGGAGNAWRLNTGTIGGYVNGVVDYPRQCMRWESTTGDGVAGYAAPSAVTVTGPDPVFRSVLFDCNTGVATSNSDTAAANAAVALAGASNVVTQSTLSSRFFRGVNEAAVPVFNATANFNAFFDNVSYVGAFGPAETPTNNWASGWTFNLFPPATCAAGTTDTGVSINGVGICNLTGPILNDIRLTPGKLYRIAGRVEVGRDLGPDAAAPLASGDAGSLTVDAGVTLFGANEQDVMIVNRGSKLFANGTPTSPVIFTSEADLRGTQADPTNAIGEWAGLILLGRAPISRCTGSGTPGTVSCSNIIEGVTNPTASYGGNAPADDSGVLRHVQVRYPGDPLDALGNDLNGITFGGVGSTTVVDYVQVHNSHDDGVEFFGGTVNVKHLIITGADDDSIDTDNGYQGNMQFAIVVQRSSFADNGFEASNVAAGSLPASDYTISNFTIVGGGGAGNAWRLNTGTIGNYVNGVVRYPRACFRWETTTGDGVAGFNAATDPTFSSVLLDCSALSASSDTAAVTAAVNAAGANNLFGTGTTSLNSTFVNGSLEAARPAFDVTTLGSFFTPVTYIGAVQNSADRWWAGWSCGLELGSSC